MLRSNLGISAGRPSASAIRATSSRPRGPMRTCRSLFSACSLTAGFRFARSSRCVPRMNTTPLGMAAGRGSSPRSELVGRSSRGTWSSPSTTMIVRIPSRSKRSPACCTRTPNCSRRSCSESSRRRSPTKPLLRNCVPTSVRKLSASPRPTP
ncbi:hypothetical protein D3C78_1189010 [compost metagenome]